MELDTINAARTLDPSVESFLRRCVCVDLEVHPKSNSLAALAAVLGSGGESFAHRGREVDRALKKLDQYAASAEFLLGHNLILFDVKHLKERNLSLQILRKPMVDTLWLNPLAYPRNPYHHLVKHYRDGGLLRPHKSDPELDAKLTLEVLSNQLVQFSGMRETNPSLLAAYHWLTTTKTGPSAGFDELFSSVRGEPRPQEADAGRNVLKLLNGQACKKATQAVLTRMGEHSWPLAYTLAWISVSGGDSVIPPWVRHQFPKAQALVSELRDRPCGDESCAWCKETGTPQDALRRWFEFPDFMPKPKSPNGNSLQGEIITRVLAKENVLGIMPTASGKSACYQTPALEAHRRTGALTVVISPLVALMEDQLEGLKRKGISSCVTINGLLSLPERGDALDQVRMGEASILLISPEQLRNRTVASAISQRQVGYWVLDEAHCLSKWGHDFRPDYLYIPRFIKRYTGKGELAPIVCLTATAKPEVVKEILRLLTRKLKDIQFAVLNGGSKRENLEFNVIEAPQEKKHRLIAQHTKEFLPDDRHSGAIIYCATRKSTEKTAEALRFEGLNAEHYHANLKPEEKKERQKRFFDGSLPVIVATNAFGMGIDKPDIRLVVHAEIPGSLENYAQEAGRAGRDQKLARCLLLYDRHDIERQFKLGSLSKLERQDIAATLKALRRHDKRVGESDERGDIGKVTVTAGEILREDEEREFSRGWEDNDTRVRVAISCLEESQHALREQNHTQVFPSSLKVLTLEEAKGVMSREEGLDADYAKKLLRIVGVIMSSEKDKGITTDYLASATRMTLPALRKALHDLNAMGIATDDRAITVYVHYGVPDASKVRFDAKVGLEKRLVKELQKVDPEITIGGNIRVSLRTLCQELRSQKKSEVRPDIVERLIRVIARDGRGEQTGSKGLEIRKIDRESLSITLRNDWASMQAMIDARRRASLLLVKFLSKLARKERKGKDIQVETTLGELAGILETDLEIQSLLGQDEAMGITKLLDHSLLWLADHEVVTLGKGLSVIRPAMQIRVSRRSKNYTKGDHQAMERHYAEKILQVHIMDKFASLGLDSMEEAEKLALDYFDMEQGAFLKKWMRGNAKDVRRPLAPALMRTIVSELDNDAQEQIVSDDREQTSVLVLACPGSGKTKMMVHRIAYLLCARRQRPDSILALAYNRHAALDIRRRLRDLVGNGATGVTVMTCHGFAMRLLGRSFQTQPDQDSDGYFRNVLEEATALLRGEGLDQSEAAAQRDTLLSGYRWIMVDEYQDIGEHEYNLISAIANRTESDPDSRLTMFAVGDDDQNIYSFRGASIEYINRFEKDYGPNKYYLEENYRSTANIIEAANHVICSAIGRRMKENRRIRVNKSRQGDPKGGPLEVADSAVGRGKVQILHAGEGGNFQAAIAMRELERLSEVVDDWSWSTAAVIAKEWKYLEPVLSYCEHRNIPAHMSKDLLNPLHTRQAQNLLRWLKGHSSEGASPTDAISWLGKQPKDPWREMLFDAVRGWETDLGNGKASSQTVCEWLAEWLWDRKRQPEGLQLLTAHRAKGLEFNDVVVLTGRWDKSGGNEDPDANRRLYYVAMTRARRNLILMRQGEQHPMIGGVSGEAYLFREDAPDPEALQACRSTHQHVGLTGVDLGFAGRLSDDSSSLAAISGLKVGDPLTLDKRGKGWVLKYGKTVVGYMAKSYAPPKDKVLASCKVFAIVRRLKSQSKAKYKSKLKRDEWEVVVPHLVFRPPTQFDADSSSAPSSLHQDLF